MSNNNSPEQQAAYRQQLQEQMNEVDAQIAYFENALVSHSQQVQKYQALSSKYPILKPFMDIEIKATYTEMNRINTQIDTFRALKQHYVTIMSALNPDYKPNNP